MFDTEMIHSGRAKSQHKWKFRGKFRKTTTRKEARSDMKNGKIIPSFGKLKDKFVHD